MIVSDVIQYGRPWKLKGFREDMLGLYVICTTSLQLIRTAIGDTKAFPIEIGFHQGSNLSMYFFALNMDGNYCETKVGSQEVVPWCIPFVDIIVCGS